MNTRQSTASLQSKRKQERMLAAIVALASIETKRERKEDPLADGTNNQARRTSIMSWSNNDKEKQGEHPTANSSTGLCLSD